VHRRDGRALASPLQLTVSSDAANEAVDRAWSAVEASFAVADAAMSRFREDSEITRLHHRGPGVGLAVSNRLRSALALADRATRVTGGRFDPRVLIDLERLGSVGVPQAWPGAGHTVDARAYRFDRCDGTVRLVSPVDLGGIGKVDIDQVLDYVHSAGTAKLLGYLELYSRYLRQRWNVDELDFTQDAEDWGRISEEQQRGLLGVTTRFLAGEQNVTNELVPMLAAAHALNRFDWTTYLSTFLMEEAKHAEFFMRWHEKVGGVLEPEEVAAFIAWLAGPGGRGASGADLLFDGGMSV